MKGTPLINLYLKQHPRSCAYGAPMGRNNRDDASIELRRYCQRIRFIDGDYSADGTYWGADGGPLYAVFSIDIATLCFYRATSRADALRQYKEGRK